MIPSFIRLNQGWNADPNVPNVETHLDGKDVLLRFNVNAMQFEEFQKGEKGTLRFVDCSQFRLGPTNDEGWYRGQCRFTGSAPRWGEFYAVVDDPSSVNGPDDWVAVQHAVPLAGRKHFLFYFRDDTFECIAMNCVIELTEDNALLRTSKSIPAI